MPKSFRMMLKSWTKSSTVFCNSSSLLSTAEILEVLLPPSLAANAPLWEREVWERDACRRAGLSS